MLSPGSIEDNKMATPSSIFNQSASFYGERIGTCSETSVVPTTPELSTYIYDHDNEIRKESNDELFQIMGNNNSKMVELSEDPLTDFKKKREERRKAQKECSSLQINEEKGRNNSKQFDYQMKPEIVDIEKENETRNKIENSLDKIMIPVGVFIQQNKTSEKPINLWAASTKTPKNSSASKIGLYIGPYVSGKEISGSVLPKSVFTIDNIEDTPGDIESKGQNLKGQSVKDKIISHPRMGSETNVDKEQIEDGENNANDDLPFQVLESQKVTNNKLKANDNVSMQNVHGSDPENSALQNVKGQSITNQTDTNVKQTSLTKNKILVKATKFLLNGEICYMIPTKVVLNEIKKNNDFKGAKNSPNPKEDKGQRKRKRGQLTHEIDDNNANNQMGREDKCHETEIRVTSLVHAKNKPYVLKGYFWLREGMQFLDSHGSQGFTLLKSIDDKVIKTRSEEFWLYPSIREVKHSHFGKSMLRISRLEKGHLESKDKGLNAQDNCCHSQDAGTCNQSMINNGRTKQEKKKDDNQCLHFVISPSKIGTFILKDSNHSQEIDQPPLWIKTNNDKRRTINDQVVPDLQHNKENDEKVKTNEYFSRRQECMNANEEMKLLLRELKCLLGIESEIENDPLDFITSATKFIIDMEISIRAILRDLGCDCPGKTVEDVLMGANFCQGSNKPLIPDDLTSHFSKQKHIPEFLMPQICGERLENRNNDLPEVPSLNRSTSPMLNIPNASSWINFPKRAPSHPASQRLSVLPLSSQLSFSDSLTDESENVNEFDLLFEKSPKHNGGSPKQNGSIKKQNGVGNGTFHSYVNEVLADFFTGDFDSCEKTTPKKTPETPTLLDFSTPIGSLSSPPLRHRSDSFAEKSSSIVESPKSFSVNSLEYDGHDDNEVSPRWYQTVEQEQQSDLYESNLLMKIIRQETRNNVWNSEGGTASSVPEMRKHREKDDLLSKKGFACGKIGQVSNEIGFDEFVRNVIDKESQNLPDDEDAVALKNLQEIAMQKNQEETLLPCENQKIIYAKDLIKSEMLASFLFPCPKFIPEDPFGVGAETVIEKTTDLAAAKENAWQGCVDVTPPQSKRSFLAQPPKLSKGKKRRTESEALIPGNKRQKWSSRRKEMASSEETLERYDSANETDSDQSTVFIPNITKSRSKRMFRAPMQKCKSQPRQTKDEIIIPNTKSKFNKERRMKTRKSNASIKRRNALKTIN